jgi:small subunit ribosomal protein S20
VPNKKAAIKYAKQSIKRNIRNRAVKSTMKTITKKVAVAIEENDAEAAKASLPAAIKVINKTAKKGVIHKNKAARLESRLVKKVNALQASPKEDASS